MLQSASRRSSDSFGFTFRNLLCHLSFILSVHDVFFDTALGGTDVSQNLETSVQTSQPSKDQRKCVNCCFIQVKYDLLSGLCGYALVNFDCSAD